MILEHRRLGFHGFQAFGGLDSINSRLPSSHCIEPEPPEAWISWDPQHRRFRAITMFLRWVWTSPMPGIGCFGKFCIRCPGNRKIAIFRFPEIRISEIRKSGNLKIQIFGFPEIRISRYSDFQFFFGKSGNPKNGKNVIGCRICLCGIPLKSMVINAHTHLVDCWYDNAIMKFTATSEILALPHGGMDHRNFVLASGATKKK